MVKFGFPLAPFILGVILGDQIEINLIRSIMTDSNPWLFVTRPISGAAARRRGAVDRRRAVAAPAHAEEDGRPAGRRRRFLAGI